MWQLLLLTRGAHMPVQLTCEECFALLDYDAEILANGTALEEIRPSVRRHLSLCSECRAKLDGWLDALETTQLHACS